MADEFSKVSASGGASIGGAVTGATTGSVLFAAAGPVIAEDNANFFYDPATHKLRLKANGYGVANSTVVLTNGSWLGSNADGSWWFGNSSAVFFNINQGNGYVSVGASSQVGFESLNAPGAGSFDTGLKRVSAGVVKVTDGGSGRGNLEVNALLMIDSTLKTVVVGAADSGGAGFKLLRIAN